MKMKRIQNFRLSTQDRKLHSLLPAVLASPGRSLDVQPELQSEPQMSAPGRSAAGIRE